MTSKQYRETSNGLTPRDGHLYWRQLFTDYFSAKGCAAIASDSLVPENDPSLLFTGAGMNQFKDDFSGNLRHGTSRATTVQKCMRTPDLENVGRTQRHHTFFEMLGFFSFGDFFKQEAIRWIWEFYTSPDWCGLDLDRLRVSIFETDDEAYGFWQDFQPHLHERGWIYRLGEHDNFWPAGCPSSGPNGVCGPCSEIFYDLGEQFSNPELKGNDNPGNNSDRFMELGNIVFTQFNRSGPIPGEGILTPLPQKNIDFGGGFERLMMVKENVRTTLDSSLFMPLRYKMREMAEDLAYKRIKEGHTLQGYLNGVCAESVKFSGPGETITRTPFKQDDMIREKRIADHVRAACFCIADGVTPSNDKQGYILRRIVRRAYRDGVKLGFDGPFLWRLVEVIDKCYGRAYPEIRRHADALRDTLKREEEAFDAVLSKGMEMLGHEMRKLDNNQNHRLAGTVAFDLHSTHGLPVDVTRDVLQENGFALDEEGFDRAFKDFREKSRAASAFSNELFDSGPMSQTRRIAKPTDFVGYTQTEVDARIVSITTTEHLLSELPQGANATIVLNQTTFYGEGGGQIGDSGILRGSDGSIFRVLDTQKTGGYHLHVGVMEQGSLKTGDIVRAMVDAERRARIRRHHSATHLLHSALRQVLGIHVQQKGSLVTDRGLRFDFSHTGKVTSDEIKALETLVSQWIMRNDVVQTDETTPDDARSRGAIMFFGEKYGTSVRMLTMGSSSCELCGGTHVARTGDIGAFQITSESSVASGVRRIEAVVGDVALEAVQREREALVQLGGLLKTNPDQLLARVEGLMAELKELKSGRKQAAKGDTEDLAALAKDVGGYKVLAHHIVGASMNDLLTIKDALVESGASDVTLLAGDSDGKASMMLAVSQALVGKGVSASELLGPIVAVVDGRGGGKKHLAQAGGKQPEKIAEALAFGLDRITEALGVLAQSTHSRNVPKGT